MVCPRSQIFSLQLMDIVVTFGKTQISPVPRGWNFVPNFSSFPVSSESATLYYGASGGSKGVLKTIQLSSFNWQVNRKQFFYNTIKDLGTVEH